MNDTKNILAERKCSLCGKIFIPAPLHVYRDRDKGTVYCSWHCFNHRNDNKQGRKTKAVEKCALSGEVVETYVSAKIASERNNADAPYIRKACRTGKFYKGYLWRYKNDLP